MIRLTREVRCSITEATQSSPLTPANDSRVRNGWAGWPTLAGLSPYLVVRVTVSGEPSPVTGYLADIKDFDKLVRDKLLPIINQIFATSGSDATFERILSQLWEPLREGIPEKTTLEQLALRPTPYISFVKDRENPEMVRVTEQFEFSASHRLHCAELSDDENKLLFGKCNNPRGHGHNYVIEVTVDGKGDETGRVISLTDLEEVVNKRLIDRFDHKHLNEDTDEFRNLNPTVENIAKVAWNLLVDSLSSAKLANIRVYETPKTWADYAG